jgi:hypothetical protein
MTNSSVFWSKVYQTTVKMSQSLLDISFIDDHIMKREKLDEYFKKFIEAC